MSVVINAVVKIIIRDFTRCQALAQQLNSKKLMFVYELPAYALQRRCYFQDHSIAWPGNSNAGTALKNTLSA